VVPLSYEHVPYPGKAEPLTHPAVMARLARARGYAAADVRTARVLELGCGDAANLGALAFRLPEASFVGVDRSAAAVGRGREMREALALTQMSLQQADLSEYEPEAAAYDYVIAHGLLSWVPAAVRKRVFTIVGAALAPSGLFHVSYNAPPAWGVRGAIRSAMVRAARGGVDAVEKVRRARAAVELLTRAQGPLAPNEHYGHLLHRELTLIRDAPDHAVLHDFLAPHHHAISIAQLAAEAANEGLRIVGELRAIGADPRAWTQRFEELTQTTGDAIFAELASDVLDRRAFRVTLLARADAPRTAPQSALEALGSGSLSTRLSRQPGLPDSVFAAHDGRFVKIDDAAAVAAVTALAHRWPRGVALPALAEEMSIDAEELSSRLASLWAAGQLDVGWGLAERSAPAPEDARPEICELNRFEARARGHLTNLMHEPVPIADAARGLVSALDGTLLESELVKRHGASVADVLTSLTREGMRVD